MSAGASGGAGENTGAAAGGGTGGALDPERLLRLGRAEEVAVSPCGSWAAVSVARLDANGARFVRDLWRVELLDASRPAQQLTRGGSDDRAPCFRRDGALGFLSNRNPREGKPEDGDDERAQVWLLPAGGDPRPLTDEPLGVHSFRFAADADRLLCLAPVLPDVDHAEQRKAAADRKQHGPSGLRYRSMPVRHWDHWIGKAAPHLVAYSEEGLGRRDLTPEADREHREAELDVSRDGRWAVLSAARIGADRLADRGLHVFDLESGAVAVRLLEPGTAFASPRFSPDASEIACVRYLRSRDHYGRRELWAYATRSGAGRPLCTGWERSPTIWAWDAAGSALLVTADDAGEVPVFRIGARGAAAAPGGALPGSGEVERITDPAAAGSHTALALVPGANLVVGLRHRTTHPPEPFRVELGVHAKPELLAALSGFGPDEGAALARVETFAVPVAGSLPVQTRFVRPAAANGPLPALLWIHGGPWSQWADGWSWRWNPLLAVSAGFAVALPNPRGSSGVSDAFLDGCWGNTWGEGPFQDVMAVADAVAARPDVDASRMAAMGGSFGGYMTNWIGVSTERFRCLVTHASLFDCGAFHGTTDNPAFWELRMRGLDPWTDPDEYNRFSPHRHIARWRSPALVIHGERDYRVGINEGLALFEALQRQGVPSELLVFPDENHWILKPRNIELWYRTWLEFVARWLR